MLSVNDRIDELDLALESYLHLDFDGDLIDNDEMFLESIMNDTSELIDSYYSIIDDTFKKPLEQYNMVSTALSSYANNIDMNQALEKTIDSYKEYLTNDYKSQLAILYKSLTQLEEIFNAETLDIKEIPALLFSIKNLTPKYLHAESKIKEIVIEIVNYCKVKLLKRYHTLLNNKLDESSYGSGSSDSSANVWENYINESRDWLLSYTLLTLFPSTLTQINHEIILEKFQEAFDEALVPFWGRFYHHLKVSRGVIEEEKHQLNLNDMLNSFNQKQIIWSFKYAKSFFLMLFELNLSLTKNQDLTSFLDIDYYQAGNKLILDKLIKFMRAHLAKIIEVYFENHASYIYSLTLGIKSKEKESSENNYMPEICSFLLRLVDSCINFDSFLSTKYKNILLKSQSKNMELKFNDNLFPGLCSVIFDSKITYHTWMSLEFSLVLTHLSDNLDKNKELNNFNDLMSYAYSDKFINMREEVFNDEFSSPTTLEVAPSYETTLNELKDLVQNNFEVPSCLNCYSIIYNNLNLFSTLIRRYQSFPFSAKKNLVDLILSPLLCFTLGLLVYRLKSHKGFHNLITNGSKYKFKKSGNCIICNDYYGSCRCIKDVLSFKSTVNYLQSSLIKFSCSTSSVLTDDSSVQKKWKIIQNWIPNVLITEEHAKLNFSPYNLLKISMRCSESFHLFFFNKTFDALVSQSSGSNPIVSTPASIHSSTLPLIPIPADTYSYRVKGSSTAEDVTLLLDNALILTRGLSITLFDVLKNELEEKVKTL